MAQGSALRPSTAIVGLWLPDRPSAGHDNNNDGDIIFNCDDGSGGVATYFYLDGSEQLNRFAKI